MTIAPAPYDDPIQRDLSQASRYVVRALEGVREKGDKAYECHLLGILHNLYRPEYLPENLQGPVLPALPSRVHRAG